MPAPSKQRLGEVAEASASWLGMLAALSASLFRVLGVDRQHLKLVLLRVAPMLASGLVGHLAAKGWFTPETQNLLTAKLTEVFIGLGVIALGSGIVHADAKRELKTVAAEQHRTAIALQLPAESTVADVEHVRRRPLVSEEEWQILLGELRRRRQEKNQHVRTTD